MNGLLAIGAGIAALDSRRQTERSQSFLSSVVPLQRQQLSTVS